MLAHQMPDAWPVFFSGRRPRPAQALVMPRILRGASILFAAPTAAGKTEAAIAPLFQRHRSFRRDLLSVIHIAPTKALVNDLHGRLTEYLDLRFPGAVRRYTGDRHMMYRDGHHDVGPGAVVALTYRATVDQPQRFVHSRAVGAHVGLTPKRYQSGEIDYDGGVSKCGDALLRTMLYEAAHALLTRGGKWSWLKAWGVRVAQRRGMRRATVAVARRLAVVLHRMWVDGSEFRWSKDHWVPTAA